jgi:hypothetical protein
MWAPPGPHIRVIRRGTDLRNICVQEVLDALGDPALQRTGG